VLTFIFETVGVKNSNVTRDIISVNLFYKNTCTFFKETGKISRILMFVLMLSLCKKTVEYNDIPSFLRILIPSKGVCLLLTLAIKIMLFGITDIRACV